MKTRSSIKEFFSSKSINWPALAVCLAVSIFIYFVYRSQQVQKEVFNSQLEIRNSGGEAFVQAGFPSTGNIKVSVVVDRESAGLVNQSDFVPYIDLRFASSRGIQEFPVLLDIGGKSKGIVTLEAKCIPSHVSMDVDEVVSGFVDVQPSYTGKPAAGFEIKSISISPPRVEVRGARSKVEGKIVLQTVPVNVSNARTSFRNDSVVLVENPLFEEVSDERFSVEVEIEPLKGRRMFDLVPVTLANVAEGLEVLSATANVGVEVYGNASALESLSPSRISVRADCSKATGAGRFTVPVSISLPQNFEVSGEVVKNIVVEFSRSEVNPEPEGGEGR